MLKTFIYSSLIALVVSCGGGGGGNTVQEPSSVPAGIYTGTVTPTGGNPEQAAAIITSDNRVALLDLNSEEAFIGTISANNLSGTLYASTSVPATSKVTTVSGNNISGTYNSSLGGGSFALVADPNLYNRTSSLSKLVGTWVDSVFTTAIGTTTWVIQTDGSYAVSSTSGCTASGTFTLFNSSNNEYNMTINVANCPDFNGSFTGFAALSDTSNTDDSLSLIFSNGALGGFFQPIKQ